MTQETTQVATASRTVLWASAFVIAALAIMQAGTLKENPAFASDVSNGAVYTLITGDSGRGGDEDPDEVLYLIDNEAEVIIAYEVDVRSKAILSRDGGSLAAYFRNALKR